MTINNHFQDSSRDKFIKISEDGKREKRWLIFQRKISERFE